MDVSRHSEPSGLIHDRGLPAGLMVALIESHAFSLPEKSVEYGRRESFLDAWSCPTHFCSAIDCGTSIGCFCSICGLPYAMLS